jgi:hypothetical protein
MGVINVPETDDNAEDSLLHNARIIGRHLLLFAGYND